MPVFDLNSLFALSENYIISLRNLGYASLAANILNEVKEVRTPEYADVLELVIYALESGKMSYINSFTEAQMAICESSLSAVYDLFTVKMINEKA